MNIDVDPDDVDTYEADGRGRIYIGPEYSNESVEVAVLGIQDDE